jgi:quercetin dioxygenase-like cupin family protein
MHTHPGEEAHVLLEGKVLYALGDEIFTVEGPYIVNIPPWSRTRS